MDSDHGDYIIWGAGDDEFVLNVGTAPEENRIVAFDASKANAAYIVLAVNNHKELVGALSDAVFRLTTIAARLNFGPPSPDDIREAYNAAYCGKQRAALAKVSG